MTSPLVVYTGCVSQLCVKSKPPSIDIFHLRVKYINQLSTRQLKRKNYLLLWDPSQYPSGFCVFPQPHLGRSTFIAFNF